MSQEHPSGSSGEKGIEQFFEEGDRGIREWTLQAAKSSYGEFLIEDHHTADKVIQILFGALGRMKDERDAVISLVSTLIKERSRVRAYMVAQNCAAERSKSLYRKVGLDEHCPKHVLAAARRSFRVILHPDTHPAYKRGEAERRFKETEAIFDEIKRLRGP
jgi:predicted nucleic acid-binding protein